MLSSFVSGLQSPTGSRASSILPSCWSDSLPVRLRSNSRAYHQRVWDLPEMHGGLTFSRYKKPANFGSRMTVSAQLCSTYSSFHRPTNRRLTLLGFDSPECGQPIESFPNHEIVTSATKTIELNVKLTRCVDDYFAIGQSTDDCVDSLQHNDKDDGTVLHRTAIAPPANPNRRLLQKCKPDLSSVHELPPRCLKNERSDERSRPYFPVKDQ